ncbi:primosomal protein N' [Virgibacillus pantothenticus]|uniref:primosomal protein N' n=1 Tax=Virgibacillus pantothenticus TaxID=1473 RepID=UPI001C23C731|nr:primosomal protein N' [Virgibacillus pantothenticus]MBU8565887.1 primosomal protein N' [Virgibacillus pantothenticus]MBU8601104.1 primosomal protein N' [Virgibacillus pantothenticus]MBU8633133.1 primosomal protein N' [Virgibacillus pantothenticus]MBU8644651.1 primosomal protein N' [Virgibacillus pantothenticus]MBU8648757.1 primosomal protein N' [Virgibacillus pantothenticus]
MNIAKVIVDVPASSIDQTFDYLIPEKFSDIVVAGARVIVPFGPRKVMGFVVEKTTASEFSKLKLLHDVLDFQPVLTKELLEIGKWLARETISLQITTFQAMLPQVLKATYKKEIVRLSEARLSEELELLFAGRDIVPYEDFIASGIRYIRLSEAVQAKDVAIEYVVQSRITKKYQTIIRPAKEIHQLEEAVLDLSKQAKKQKQLLQFFLQHPQPVEKQALLKQLKTSDNTLRELQKKGLLESFQQEVYRDPYAHSDFPKTEALNLTGQQAEAIKPMKETIENERHAVFLLHGITGSGKTEIYLQVIQAVIEKGAEAIVLVPEISLTPQMVKRFKGRFGSNVAVMHSALSAGEKYDEWRRVQRKEVQVVVGARSAIFAPFENLGVIIIDEEHESTYKQEDQPRYHARDVAIQRGQHHKCPVILGSATPMLESYARASKGVYQLTTLDKRTNNKELPPVEIVDMRKELHAGNRTMFSRTLKAEIEACLQKGEQIVLLLNRRGYSTFVMCRDCGHVKECPHCDIALTFHKNSHALKCHYCSYEEPMPIHCPECGSDTIRYFGTGTQRVEEALVKLIPEARVIRMDVDTTRRKGSHEKLLHQFATKQADILLGTQMIAKGLDFENVTLVGVLTADSMLHLPDFRSAEKTFQILTQVSGRAGRHELNGKVVVQTYTPDHYSIQLASTYDYTSFYQKEMLMRKTFHYPPYFFLALITVTHTNQVKAIQSTQQMVQMLSKVVHKQTILLGPTPSPIPRIKNRYRYQCMIKYRNEPHLQDELRKIMEHFSEQIRKDGLLISIDMQPYHLM